MPIKTINISPLAFLLTITSNPLNLSPIAKWGGCLPLETLPPLNAPKRVPAKESLWGLSFFSTVKSECQLKRECGMF